PVSGETPHAADVCDLRDSGAAANQGLQPVLELL
ncbi:MAG: hypothetical protein QOI79_613, partial [Mycobacterium sp.]|nr:hypothetical protein [Mycobacterium sp.]